MPPGSRRLTRRPGRPPEPPSLVLQQADPDSMYAAHLDQPTEPSLAEGNYLRVRSSAGPLAIWLGLLVLYFVWGSTYIGIRLAHESIPPFLMAGTRFLMAGAALLAWEVLAVRRMRSDPPTPGGEG